MSTHGTGPVAYCRYRIKLFLLLEMTISHMGRGRDIAASSYLLRQSLKVRGVQLKHTHTRPAAFVDAFFPTGVASRTCGTCPPAPYCVAWT